MATSTLRNKPCGELLIKGFTDSVLGNDEADCENDDDDDDDDDDDIDDKLEGVEEDNDKKDDEDDICDDKDDDFKDEEEEEEITVMFVTFTVTSVVMLSKQFTPLSLSLDVPSAADDNDDKGDV